ncbi:MAG: glycosyltransferase family 9 protein [Candidatus Paceibacterota bacterium]
MFRAVKDKYPNAQVTVLGNKINQKLLEGNTDVDDYIVYNEDNTYSMIVEVKKRNPDFACITSPDSINLAILYLAGIPLVVAPVIKGGWSPLETRSYKMLRNLVEVRTHTMGKYAPREYLRLLEPINIYTDDTQKHLAFSKEADSNVSRFLKEYGIQKDDFIVGISPSAGNKIKEWPVDRFAEVADYLQRNNKNKAFIIGGPEDSGLSQKMSQCMDTEVRDTTGKWSIDELKAFISKLNLFISVDTGPIYIAEAFGVPTIDIVGPIDEREQPPINKKHKVVVPKREKPELHVMNARVYNHREVRVQAESISVDMVKNAVKELQYVL